MPRSSLFSSCILAAAWAIVLALAASPANAAKLKPGMAAWLDTAADDLAHPGSIIVAFHGDDGLADAHVELLENLGITKGFLLDELGMAAVPATAAQIRALAASDTVRSIRANEELHWFDFEATTLTGVNKLRHDMEMTLANGGLPVSGKGDFSIVINDSGIDALHPDLAPNVIQNVQILSDTETLAGFTTVIAIEDVPNTDTHIGHGTHVAGTVAGSGQMSGGKYAGVAPGAKLIGTGSGAGLFILAGLGGFEWALSNQFRYNIRVITNSWGSSGDFDPDDPINIASKKAADRNIVVLFAAGNSGPGRDSHNPYAKAPWVISVAAGTKEGGLADFSSRGLPADIRYGDDDPNNDFDAPTITAPGTGRAFDANAGRFTSDIVSTRATTNVVSNGLTNDTEIESAYVPWYTQISGTSMATPHAAGVVALMLDADPTLSVEEIRQILIETASKMPGYEDFEVGAGYINAHAAVEKVFERDKPYGEILEPDFNLALQKEEIDREEMHVDYNPAALPGPDSPNARHFSVGENIQVLDVFARFDNAIYSGDGNSIGLLLTDPNGNEYSSGLALPILDGLTRQVVVENPVPGEWLLEVRGIRGLAAVPSVRLPTSGAAAPGPVDITLREIRFLLPAIADVEGHAAQEEIEFALKNRMMDVDANGNFNPDADVTRADLARALSFNTPLRQQFADTPRFADVDPGFRTIAESVTANGSTLRDWDFDVDGMMSPSALTFDGAANARRLDLAVALVRALGLDAQAQALAGSDVTVTRNGETLVVADNADIPPELRGYVQIALDRQLLQAFFSLEQDPFEFEPTLTARVRPLDPTSRAFLAIALANYRAAFAAGY